jgi:hypothetical protein
MDTDHGGLPRIGGERTTNGGNDTAGLTTALHRWTRHTSGGQARHTSGGQAQIRGTARRPRPGEGLTTDRHRSARIKGPDNDRSTALSTDFAETRRLRPRRTTRHGEDVRGKDKGNEDNQGDDKRTTDMGTATARQGSGRHDGAQTGVTGGVIGLMMTPT